MGGTLQTPSAGDGLSAAWARQLVEEVRSHRLNVCPPLMLSRTPSGTTLRMGPSAPAPSTGISKPWDVTFAGAVATFTDCEYPRGPITKFLADIEYTVTGADGDIWLASKIDTESGTAEIIEGAEKTDVTDQAVPTDKYEKRLLYKIRKHTSAGIVSIRVTGDHRCQPVQVNYV